MVNKDSQAPQNSVADVLKSWVMVALTLIFVVLYTLALLGWLKPLSDVSMIARLEPIIFVIIGYYFGRLPAQQNEKTLKDEITRQTQKSDAAQHSKEQAHMEREALEEKIKNVKAALQPSQSSSLRQSASAKNFDEEAVPSSKNSRQDYAVEAAIRILNS